PPSLGPSVRTTSVYTLSLHDALPIFTARSLAHACAFSYAARIRSAHRVHCVRDRRRALCVGGSRRRSSRHGAHCNGSTCERSNRSEEHTSELQSRENLVCRLLLEKNK